MLWNPSCPSMTAHTLTNEAPRHRGRREFSSPTRSGRTRPPGSRGNRDVPQLRPVMTHHPRCCPARLRRALATPSGRLSRRSSGRRRSMPQDLTQLGQWAADSEHRGRGRGGNGDGRSRCKRILPMLGALTGVEDDHRHRAGLVLTPLRGHLTVPYGDLPLRCRPKARSTMERTVMSSGWTT